MRERPVTERRKRLKSERDANERPCESVGASERAKDRERASRSEARGGDRAREKERDSNGLLGSPFSASARRASFGLPFRRDGRSFLSGCSLPRGGRAPKLLPMLCCH